MTAPLTLARVPAGGAVSCRNPQPAAIVRLVCFPHSGGGPSLYRRWTTGLAPDVEVWPVTLPGRGPRAREPFVQDWPSLVAEVTDAILENVPGPVALFGHSLGALQAYEVGRAMAREGAPPAHLFVSAYGCPKSKRERTLPADDAELIRVVDEIYQGIPNELRDSPVLRERFAPVLRADLELAVSYAHRPGPLLSCPVTALGGAADPAVSAETRLRWRGYTSGSFASHEFPGGHFYLESAPRDVLETVRTRLVESGPTALGA